MPAAGQYLKQCKRGHLREGDNLLITSSNRRVCRKCHTIRYKNYTTSEHGRAERVKAMAKYRKNNRERIRERSRLRTRKAQEFVNTIKSSSCIDCGNRYPTCAMDLDHVRGKKKDDISGLIASGSTLRILIEEIDKCELVCANCHRVRTHKRRQGNGS